jgi:tetratricopeptide (TPR) repeat protein
MHLGWPARKDRLTLQRPMTFRSFFLILLIGPPLCVPTVAAQGAQIQRRAANAPRPETTPEAKPAVLKDIPAWRQGVDALDTELWEVADKRFEEALQTPGLTAADHLKIEWKRLQAWIRGNRAADALAKLKEPAFTDQPETYFWKAQALAALGRFTEAANEFAPALENTKAPHRNEALLSRANLQLAIGDSDGAFVTLEALASTRDPAMVRLAKLRQTDLLLDQGKTAEARKLLPPPNNLPPADMAEQAFLEAKLLLAEGKSDEAISTFAALRDQAAGQSQARYRAAALGMADALAAAGNTEEASEQLLSELQKQKDSPLLPMIFKRLLAWLPAQPAADDPVLERLKQWIPATPAVQSPLIATAVENDPILDTSGAADAFPSNTVKTGVPNADLIAHSLYTRAIGCYRQGTTESRHEADSLMNRLRLEFPGHPLVPAALLEMGRWRLAEGKAESAFAALDAVTEISNDSAAKGKAVFLKARSEFEQGRPEAALALFEEAAKLLPDHAAETAKLNAGLIRLQGGGTPVILDTGNEEDQSRLAMDLELERALSLTDPLESRLALDRFLTRHPSHSRRAEARLAAASNALKSRPADPTFARNQIELIEADPDSVSSISTERLAWLKVELADQSESPKAAIESARQYLAAFPNSDRAPEAALIQGRAMFRNEDYHNGRLVLERMAASVPDSTAAPAALMLAARAAALGATEQSREEGLALYSKIVAGKGSLAPLARLERASLLNDLGRFDTTVSELQPWFDSMKPGEPLRIPAGLLLADAHYAQGMSKPTSLPAALKIFEQLLAEAADNHALINRLQYQRGMTYERLASEDPEAIAKAMESYFSVLQSADERPPAEWKWFENCGFRALKLQEDKGEWVSAMKIASKIASFKGPRAAEAAERANTIRMDHQLYDD